MPNVLIIDDEAGIRELLTKELIAEGYGADAAASGPDAMAKIKKGHFQVALCDINMPQLGGLEVLEEIRQRDSDIEVIMMTGYATVETAVTAMKRGAYDFVQKPFNLNEVLALVAKSLEKSDLKSIVQELREAKRRLEDTQHQLIQSEKLAGIGRLAAGVAHELNNPLTGVLGFAELLLNDPQVGPEQKKDLETIRTQGQRCRTIIQNLLQFSRRKEPKKERLDLLPLLESTLELVAYDFSTSGIEVIKQFSPPLAPVFADADQLQQVFLNLITNARHSMEGKSSARLTIEARVQGPTVVVGFRDTGHGIPEDIHGKIFDPFFTTKPPGKGTGLGLSICYGILQDHRGSLRFTSQPDLGTTFIVELPAYE